MGKIKHIGIMKNIALSMLMSLSMVFVSAKALGQEAVADSTAAVADSAATVADSAAAVVTSPAEAEEEGIDIKELVGHHVSDSHTWNIFGYTNDKGEEVEVKIPLPVMAYYKGSFLFTMSSSFDEGKEVTKGAYTFYMEHDKLHVKGTEDKPFDFSLTRNVASMMLSCILLIVVFVGAARSLKKTKIARGGVNLAEMAVLFVKDIADDQIGKEKSGKYTNYLLTLFFFIWFNNLIGLIPFFPGSSNLSGNISFTAILAVFTFVVTNWNGTKAYWKHNLTVPGVPLLMKVILIPVEIISMFTKPFTLLVRLFANITGGHILVLSLFSVIFIVHSYAMAVPSVLLAFLIFTLELIFGALQAYIFTLLSALYIGLAVNQEDHHE